MRVINFIIIVLLIVLLATILLGCKNTSELEERIKKLENQLKMEEGEDTAQDRNGAEDETQTDTEEESVEPTKKDSKEFNLEIVKNLDFASGMSADDILVQENYAFLAQYDVLRVYDISDAENLNEAGSLKLNGLIMGLSIAKNYLYAPVRIDKNNYEIVIIDISDKNSPKNVGSYEFDTHTNRIFITGERVYTLFSKTEKKDNGMYELVDAGFHILDISEKDNPSIISTYKTDKSFDDIFVLDNHAYVVCKSVLEVLDISDLDNISIVDKFPFPDRIGYLDIKDNIAYIPTGPILQIVDISNNDLKLLGEVEVDGQINCIFTEGDYIYLFYSVYDQNHTRQKRGFVVINATDKSKPEVADEIEISNEGPAARMSAIDEYAYLAMGYNVGGLAIIKLFAGGEE